MNARTIFQLFLMMFASHALWAQTLSDAVRYSVLEAGGTARTVGTGGSISALGADFAILSTNPAGLAAFRRSEFTFTPAFERTATDASLDGPGNELYDRNKFNFNFSNIGLVFPSSPLSPNWTNSVVGIGVNRLASYHQRMYFEGTSAGSITDRWLELAQGFSPDQLDGFEAGPAFDAGAIYTDNNDETLYFSDFLEGESVDKSQAIKRKGAYNEIVFSFAGNYRERLLIGATFGIPILNYEETKTYEETDDSDANPLFNQLRFTETLRSSGAGINVKLGLIFRVSQMVRLGAAIHSPTGLRMTDNFTTDLLYSYSLNGTINSGEAASPDGTFEYRIRTPWRAIGSAGLIFGKSGFLSADIEYLDYSKARFIFNQAATTEDLEYEQELNNQAENELASAVNIRLGGEFAYEMYRFRGGYSILAAPYAEGFDPSGALSLGAGVRWENVFLDVAFRRQLTTGTYLPYLVNDQPAQTVASDEKRGRVMLTVGFKF